MGKKFNDEKLPKNLKEFFTSETNGGAKKELQEVNNVIKQINETVRNKNIEKVKAMVKEEKSKKDISNKLGLSISTVYRYCKK